MQFPFRDMTIGAEKNCIDEAVKLWQYWIKLLFAVLIGVIQQIQTFAAYLNGFLNAIWI